MLLYYSIAHNAIILTIWSNGIYGKFFRYHLFFITIDTFLLFFKKISSY